MNKSQHFYRNEQVQMSTVQALSHFDRYATHLSDRIHLHHVPHPVYKCALLQISFQPEWFLPLIALELKMQLYLWNFYVDVNYSSWSVAMPKLPKINIGLEQAETQKWSGLPYCHIFFMWLVKWLLSIIQACPLDSEM